MIIEWWYKDKQYVITGMRGYRLSLNGYSTDLCKWLLINLDITSQYASQKAMVRAQEAVELLECTHGTAKMPQVKYDPDITLSMNGTKVKAKWFFEGERYVVEGDRRTKVFYINDYRLDNYEAILKNIKSNDEGLANRAKINAKNEFERQKYINQKLVYNGKTYTIHERNGMIHIDDCPVRYDGEKILKWIHSGSKKDAEKAGKLAEKLCQMEPGEALYYHEKQSLKYKIKQRFSLENFGFVLLCMACFAILAGIIYFIYWIWWGMIGEWAFEGPFADDTSAGEVTFKTIIFFIAFIVIIEEAIRRIRNGHF